jgi:AcrR family transcriptional regulator
MASEAGLRERKRRQTRQALVGAAMRLFEEKGYDETTVAEIAAAAGVSTKTFFNYFASKDEVLFPHLHGRIDRAVSVIEHRGPGEDLADVLIRAMEQMLADAVRDELAAGLAWARLPLLMSVPAVQAATLRRYFLAETQLAEALHRAYPDILDLEAAAAVIGSLMGAVLAAALASMEHGGSTGQVQAAARRAMDIAIGGLRLAGRGAPPSPGSLGGPADGPACPARRGE